MGHRIAAPRDDILANAVRVKPGFMRSVNLRRDRASAQPLEGYVLSAHVLTSLHRLLSGYQSSQHAWTLTGPYGSGKSMFALFLSALLHPNHPAHAPAMAKLQHADAELVKLIGSLPPFLPVLAVGRRASPSVCLLEAVAETPTLPNDLRDEIRAHLRAGHFETRSLESLVLTSIEQLSQSGKQPLLIVLDELGKTLEYATLHPRLGDIYVLQQIAEMAPRWNVLFIGILHQAFEQYAQSLEQSIRTEWAKVQGRFEDIPFVESPEQMMRLLAYAIETDNTTRTVEQGREYCRHIAQDMVTMQLTPPGIRASEFIRLSEQAYPLHPMTFALLPYLFRHHAQNERSLFAFLALNEPFGFQQFLHHPVSDDARVALFGLSYLFDYVTANFRHSVYTSVPLRPVAQVEQLLLREEWSAAQRQVLKTLALLQWAGEVGSLRPTWQALRFALCADLDEAELEETLQHLRRRSAIVYRSFNRTFCVWQGSDVDVEERLQEARRQTRHQVSLASVLNQLVPSLPVVARRHSYQTGTLRAFEVRYIDDHVLRERDTQKVTAPSQEYMAGVVCVCLPRYDTQVEVFEEWARSSELSQQSQCVVGIPQQAAPLHELLVELACLDWVQSHTPALRDDPVARRELRERTDLVRAAIREQIQHALRSCRWFYRGEDWTAKAQRSLSHLISELCDQLYSQSPILHNELLNRWTISSAAAAGRRNLIQRMLEHPEQERLAINGYPPERSMYESVLHATGLHVPVALGWRFEPPPAEHPRRLYPLWQYLYQRIFVEPPELVNVADLLRELMRPPYGITPGVFPVILCAFLQVYRDETSLYREGTYLPEPSIADWEVLLRRPELFAVAGCRTEGAKAHMLRLIAHRWGVEPKTVAVVRELVRRIRQLPDHAKRTKRLSSEAIALRQAVLRAHSPERLLYHDIPDALGVPIERVEQFQGALENALDELGNITPSVVAWARDELLRACGLPAGAQGWRTFREEATALRGRALNSHLTPLLIRAAFSATGEPSDEASLESVLALIGGRPPRSWTDVEIERFPEAARLYGEAFRQATTLASQEVALSPEEEQQRDALLQLLRQMFPQNLSPRVRFSVLMRLMQEAIDEQ